MPITLPIVNITKTYKEKYLKKEHLQRGVGGYCSWWEMCNSIFYYVYSMYLQAKRIIALPKHKWNCTNQTKGTIQSDTEINAHIDCRLTHSLIVTPTHSLPLSAWPWYEGESECTCELSYLEVYVWRGRVMRLPIIEIECIGMRNYGKGMLNGKEIIEVYCKDI